MVFGVEEKSSIFTSILKVHSFGFSVVFVSGNLDIGSSGAKLHKQLQVQESKGRKNASSKRSMVRLNSEKNLPSHRQFSEAVLATT